MKEFYIIKNDCINKYEIKYNEKYSKFMNYIKDNYSVREYKYLTDTYKSSVSGIIAFKAYDRILNEKILSRREHKQIDGDCYVDVEFIGVIYPFIYKLLKNGFELDKLKIINYWNNNTDIKYMINKENNLLKEYGYSNDRQIRNKDVLMNKYFECLDFELVNQTSIEDYYNIINGAISNEAIEALKEHLIDAQTNTELIDNSVFKNLIYNKLDTQIKSKEYVKEIVK